MTKHPRSAIRLPKGWKTRIRSAVLHVIALAKYSLASAYGLASSSVPRKADYEDEIAKLREEIRIKDARMAHLPPHRRPHYPPTERMAILELRAARNWSLAQTAKAFLVTEGTVSSWMHRLDEQGPEALVALREPVNKFPEFVRYIVQRLRTLCPTMGKLKIAQTLARAGLHLGATTVGRMLKAPPAKPPMHKPAATKTRIVTARSPNHVWHIDLTTVPIASGFWVPWTPCSLLQCWPFCWWVAVIVDHFSRRVMGTTTFTSEPTSKAVQLFLHQTIRQAQAQPKHLICDKGSQFWCDGFKCWSQRREIRPRFGAVNRHGSIAVVERLILTLKQFLSLLILLSQQRSVFRKDLQSFADWFNEFRPHTSLGGRTPNEVYYRRFPAVRRPRHEPRRNWPRGSPCAKPWALTRSGPGTPLELDVEFHAGRRHLPIVTLKRAA